MRKILLLLALTAALSAAASSTEYKPGPFYYQRASLFEALPTSTSDIIMLGNSITNGCEWHELLGSPCVKNRGISGDGIDGIWWRIDPIIAGHPAKIFLMIGINDLSRGMTADEIATSILELAHYIGTKSPETKLYIQSVLPYNPSFSRFQALMGKADGIKRLNTLLKEGASDYGYTYIDLYPSFADAKDWLDSRYTNDGLHLTGAGYLLWAELLKPYID